MKTLQERIDYLICGGEACCKQALAHETDQSLIAAAIQQAEKKPNSITMLRHLRSRQRQLERANAPAATTPSMPKPKASSPSTALAVLARPNLQLVQISKLQGITLQQMEKIRHLQLDASLRALFVGIALHQIKAALKHGEWMPWLKGNLEGAGYRQANYYMRLATIFVEEGRVKAAEIDALPAGCAELAPANFKGDAKRLFDQASKFIDGRSLNELLCDYGVKDGKKIGGARAKAAAGGAAPSATQLSEQKIEEISAWLEQGRNLLVTENALQYLAPPVVRGTVETLDKLADQVRSAAKPILR
jgi:hypothetical protein